MKLGDVTIRAWEGGDFDRLRASAPRLSRRTLCLRFLGPVPTLPSSYLRSTAERWPSAWDAVVALIGADLVGWAEYGVHPNAPQTADVAVCVVDDEQGRGIGTALLGAVIEHARRAGLHSVPQAFGVRGAFWIARAMHAGMAVLLFVMLHAFGLGIVALLGVLLCVALLAYEHAIVSPGDLRRLNAAFFTLNGVISVVFFVFIAADVLHRR